MNCKHYGRHIYLVYNARTDRLFHWTSANQRLDQPIAKGLRESVFRLGARVKRAMEATFNPRDVQTAFEVGAVDARGDAPTNGVPAFVDGALVERIVGQVSGEGRTSIIRRWGCVSSPPLATSVFKSCCRGRQTGVSGVNGEAMAACSRLNVVPGFEDTDFLPKENRVRCSSRARARMRSCSSVD